MKEHMSPRRQSSDASFQTQTPSDTLVSSPEETPEKMTPPNRTRSEVLFPLCSSTHSSPRASLRSFRGSSREPQQPENHRLVHQPRIPCASTETEPPQFPGVSTETEPPKPPQFPGASTETEPPRRPPSVPPLALDIVRPGATQRSAKASPRGTSSRQVTSQRRSSRSGNSPKNGGQLVEAVSFESPKVSEKAMMAHQEVLLQRLVEAQSMLEDLENRCVRDRSESELVGEHLEAIEHCQELRAESSWLSDQQIENELLLGKEWSLSGEEETCQVSKTPESPKSEPEVSKAPEIPQEEPEVSKVPETPKEEPEVSKAPATPKEEPEVSPEGPCRVRAPTMVSCVKHYGAGCRDQQWCRDQHWQQQKHQLLQQQQQQQQHQHSHVHQMPPSCPNAIGYQQSYQQPVSRRASVALPAAPAPYQNSFFRGGITGVCSSPQRLCSSPQQGPTTGSWRPTVTAIPRDYSVMIPPSLMNLRQLQPVGVPPASPCSTLRQAPTLSRRQSLRQ